LGWSSVRAANSSMSTTSHFGKEVGYNRAHYHSANLGSNWMAASAHPMPRRQ